MHGNVLEWCEDDMYGWDDYDSDRANRGGSWLYIADDCAAG